MAAEHDVAARAAHALDRVDPGQQLLQRLGVLGADLEDQAGVAGDGMQFLDLGGLGQCQHRLRLAPAGGVDMDGGAQRAPKLGTVQAGDGCLDDAIAAQPLDPLMHRGRRQMEPLAELGVAEAGILGQEA